MPGRTHARTLRRVKRSAPEHAVLQRELQRHGFHERPAARVDDDGPALAEPQLGLPQEVRGVVRRLAVERKDVGLGDEGGEGWGARVGRGLAARGRGVLRRVGAAQGA